MRDAFAIASAAESLRARRTPILVATVVRIEGSSYRRPGARLIATEEGRVAGSISGGCLERDLLRTGSWRSRQGPIVVRYDSREPEDGEPVLGCGGIVEVLIEQGTAGADDDPLAMLTTAMASPQPVILATVFQTSDPNIPLGARWALTRGELVEGSHSSARDIIAAIVSAGEKALTSERAVNLELATGGGVALVLVEAILPTPHLFVFGSGSDVLPLVATARQLGWQVTVWSASESFESRSRLVLAGATVESALDVVRARIDASHRAMAVVMSHNLSHDRRALLAALESRAMYIGVLGPHRRTESLAVDLPNVSLSDPRVHAPVGLDLGAETPEEIALSIASEILARLRGASHVALRQRANIHGDDGDVR